jgi:type IV secretory pathway VirB2 component (pilin)
MSGVLHAKEDGTPTLRRQTNPKTGCLVSLDLSAASRSRAAVGAGRATWHHETTAFAPGAIGAILAVESIVFCGIRLKHGASWSIVKLWLPNTTKRRVSG